MRSNSGHRGVLALAWPLLLILLGVQAIADERLVPLTELGAATYRGEEGGLYGDGKNEPPAKQRKLAKEAISKVQPLDEDGRPSADGNMVLLAIGMSNTTQEFSAFVQLANRDRRNRSAVVLVDGAQGGADAAAWVGGGRRSPKGDPWRGTEARLTAAGATPEQVQAVWIKQALAGPARYGEFPGHVQALADDLAKIVQMADERYPNLRVAFLSSRIYGGYASTRLNPEPYAYESAFAVREVITRQVDGNAALNCDPNRGAVRAPVLLWGPYLWADGETPRKSDRLVWRREDFGNDGTHPSNQGRRKVAEQLLDFFTNNEFGKGVFMR